MQRGGLADDPRKDGLAQPDSKSQKSCDELGVEELKSDSLIMFEAFSSHASPKVKHDHDIIHFHCPTNALPIPFLLLSSSIFLLPPLAQEGDRLKYQLLKGEGPPTGWVSLTTGGKQPLGKPIEAVSLAGVFFSLKPSVIIP